MLRLEEDRGPRFHVLWYISDPVGLQNVVVACLQATAGNLAVPTSILEKQRALSDSMPWMATKDAHSSTNSSCQLKYKRLKRYLVQAVCSRNTHSSFDTMP